MRISKLISSEIRVRPWSFTICSLVVAVSVSAFITGPMLMEAYAEETDDAVKKMELDAQAQLAKLDKQTRRIMRDLGINLRIVHQDTNLSSLYTEFSAVDFPESYVDQLAKAPQIKTIVHVIATLQEKITWKQRTVLLVGMRPVLTSSQKNEEKPHMVKSVESGTVILGHELGAGLKAGDRIDILGTSFTIASIRPQTGTLEDVQLVTDLHDAQALVNKPGKIHQILALNCKCAGDRISQIRKELESVLPDTKVTEHLTRATAREEQRDTVEKAKQQQIKLLKENRERSETSQASLLSVILPLTLLFSATIICLLSWLNVRERRREIGILRALGKRGGTIAMLFLGKAILIGLTGGLIGCVGGYLTTQWFISQSAEGVFAAPVWEATLWMTVLLGAPVVACMSAYIPTLMALSQDPASILSS